MPDDRHSRDHDAGANLSRLKVAQEHPDGTAIMNTLQQMAGAIGTAVAVSIMAAGQKNYMSTVKNPNDPSAYSHALIAGVQHAFIFAMIVAVIGLISAFFMKRVKVNHS